MNLKPNWEYLKKTEVYFLRHECTVAGCTWEGYNRYWYDHFAEIHGRGQLVRPAKPAYAFEPD